MDKWLDELIGTRQLAVILDINDQGDPPRIAQCVTLRTAFLLYDCRCLCQLLHNCVLFWQNASILPCAMPCVRRRRHLAFIVHYKVSDSSISRMVWPRIIQFDTDTDMLYSHTSYDITSYFWSAITEVRKIPKMLPPTAFGRILVAFSLAQPIGGLHVS